MLRMPVSTLRIWEQRYKVVAPATTPSGHRLYVAADVQRLALLKQLTDHGHAIGAIAALSAAQLQQVASTHVSIAAGARAPRQLARASSEPPAPAPWRLVVVGAALARRLQRPALTHGLARPAKIVAVFDNLAQAVSAASATKAADVRPVDLLLWQLPSLQAGALGELNAAVAAWGARRAAVAYRFAGAAATKLLAAARVDLVREPQDDHALGAWLATLDDAPTRADADLGPGSPPTPLHGDALWWLAGDAAPRRFDDATLTDFAGLSTTIACECPRHVAELLLQLSNFEAYSADCAQRSPADAELHAYLQRVAGASRALFEAALERVAIQEGLMLPAP